MEQNLKYLFILPIYNEDVVLSQSVNLLTNFLQTSWAGENKSWKIILADNGSTDNTEAQAKLSVSQNPNRVEYLNTTENGRGQALRATVKKYQADIYCYLDIDLPIELQELPKLLEQVDSKQCDIAVGKRTGQRPLLRKILTTSLRQLNFLLFGFQLQDVQSGIKVWNKKSAELMLECRETGFFLDTEFVARSKQDNLKICEVPVNWIERRYPRRISSVQPLQDSYRAIKALWRISNKIYPNFSKNILLFFGLCITTIALSISCLLFLVQADFRTALSIPEARQTTANWAIICLLVYGLFWYLMAKMKSAPWRLILLSGIFIFLVNAGVAVATAPTTSQDLYWNLALTRGWHNEGLNPYTTTPTELIQDEWTKPIIQWRGLSMTHGPAWVLFLFLFVSLNFSMVATMTLIKIFFALTCLLIGWIWWKVMGLHGWTLEKKTKFILLGAFSPFIIQALIVDTHNDILIILGILSSYYFLIKKQFWLSIFTLLLSGFIKYVPWLLIIVPLWELIKIQRNWFLKFKTVALVGLVFLILTTLFYLPFGLPWHNSSGLSQELVDKKLSPYQLFTTYIWFYLPFVNNLIIRIAGLIIAVGVLIFYLFKNKFSKAYSLPYLAMLIFATPWFMPWYGLWSYPITALLVSLDLFVLFNMILFLTQLSTPLAGSLLGAAGIAFYVFIRYLLKNTVLKRVVK